MVLLFTMYLTNERGCVKISAIDDSNNMIITN